MDLEPPFRRSLTQPLQGCVGCGAFTQGSRGRQPWAGRRNPFGVELRTQDSGLSTQDSGLSTQHTALSTQHSALRTQHSALSTQSHSQCVTRVLILNVVCSGSITLSVRMM